MSAKPQAFKWAAHKFVTVRGASSSQPLASKPLRERRSIEFRVTRSLLGAEPTEVTVRGHSVVGRSWYWQSVGSGESAWSRTGSRTGTQVLRHAGLEVDLSLI